MDSVIVKPVADGEYVRLLQADFPELKISSLKHIGSGWDTAAMLVNGEYVFRFARELFDYTKQAPTARTEREINLLNALRGKLSFAIPQPEYIATGNRYFGYKILPGALWSSGQNEPNLSDDFLQDWVNIRNEISDAIEPSVALSLGAKKYKTSRNEEYIERYINSPIINPVIAQLAKKAIESVKNCTKDDSNWRFIHGDLKPDNCLVDSKTKKITGVIDFGDSEVAPAEADYYHWCKHRDPKLLKKLTEHEAEKGVKLNIELVHDIYKVYCAADYVDFTERGLQESAKVRLEQLQWYVDSSSKLGAKQ